MVGAGRVAMIGSSWCGWPGGKRRRDGPAGRAVSSWHSCRLWRLEAFLGCCNERKVFLENKRNMSCLKRCILNSVPVFIFLAKQTAKKSWNVRLANSTFLTAAGAEDLCERGWALEYWYLITGSSFFHAATDGTDDYAASAMQPTHPISSSAPLDHQIPSYFLPGQYSV